MDPASKESSTPFVFYYDYVEFSYALERSKGGGHRF